MRLMYAPDAARTIRVMNEPLRQARLTIEFDGERVIGELRDERGTVSAFSGWLALISAVDSLATPASGPEGTPECLDRSIG